MHLADHVSAATTDGIRAFFENLAEGLLTALDCIVYTIILIQQLLYQVGSRRLFRQFILFLPFLFISLPLSFLHGPSRPASVRRSRGHPDDLVIAVYHDIFAETASFFDVVAVRCLRWGVDNIPLDIQRIFMSNNVAVSYWLWRKWRSAGTRSLRVTIPVFFDIDKKFTGIWMKRENNKPSDIVVYYIHGGGFFTKLEKAGYKNPTVFAIDYSLAPEAQHPVQVRQVLRGYQYAVSLVGDESRVCVVADSAGGFLAMSLMTAIGSKTFRKTDLASDITPAPPVRGPVQKHRHTMVKNLLDSSFKAPGMLILISPWISLVSDKHHTTASDYVTPDKLTLWAETYAPGVLVSSKSTDSLVGGPMLTTSGVTGSKPKYGYIIWYGEEEVLADDIRWWTGLLRSKGSQVTTIKRASGIHIWPALTFFIRANKQRLDDVNLIIDRMLESINPKSLLDDEKRAKRSKWPLDYSPRQAISQERARADQSLAADKRPRALFPVKEEQQEAAGSKDHHSGQRRFSLRWDKTRQTESKGKDKTRQTESKEKDKTRQAASEEKDKVKKA